MQHMWGYLLSFISPMDYDLGVNAHLQGISYTRKAGQWYGITVDELLAFNSTLILRISLTLRRSLESAHGQWLHYDHDHLD